MHFKGVFVAGPQIVYPVGMGVIEFGKFLGKDFNRNVLELKGKACGFTIELFVAVCLWEKGTWDSHRGKRAWDGEIRINRASKVI